VTPPLELHDEGRSTTGYWRNFAFASEPGSVWIQQVDTSVTCYTGQEPWLEFRNVYGEYFVLDGEGGLGGPDLERPWLDLHAFDVLVDGWGRSGLRTWLAGQPGQERRPPARLEVTKRFRLVRGGLRDVDLPESHPQQGAFGYLLQPPFSDAVTRLEFCLEPRAEVDLCDPTQRAARGAAELGALSSTVWEAVERYRFSYPTLSGKLVSATDYALLTPERTTL